LVKRIHFTDISLWAVLGMNIFLIYSYIKTPSSIDTILLLFYVQSICIGIFNALDIFTVTNAAKDLKTDNVLSTKGCAGFLFIFHYGMFHLVYYFFLSRVINLKNIDWQFAKLSFYILITACLINFTQDKIRNRTEAISIGSMFFMPYVRIVPIHLMILAPAFLHVSAPLVFLVLKTAGDVLTQIVYKKAVFKPLETAAKSANSLPVL